MIIDIHTHTYPTSDDSFLMPDQLIEEAKRIGLDGICITDHDGFWRPEEIEELSRRHSYPVLPGCEVTTEEGHLLVYGLDRYIFGMHRASFVRKLVDEAGGAIVVAHPYRRAFWEHEADGDSAYREMVDRASDSPALAVSDAVEVGNGRGTRRQNAFSQDVADRLGMKGTGASDAHRLEDLGTYATEFSRNVRSVDDLIAELLAGRFRPVDLQRRTALLTPSAGGSPAQR